jgi:hypothetical protein
VWTWVSTARAGTGYSVLTATTTSGNAVTADFIHMAGVLAEPTTSTSFTYFDGGSGDDYIWEEGTTATTGRSFYYENRVERTEAMMRALQDAAPLGIGIGTPRFGVWAA